MTRFADVLLPLPVSTPYRYAIPDALAGRVVPGARVVVPVRRRRAVGVVVAETDEPPTQAARAVLEAPDPEPALSAALLRLGEWLSAYYGCPLGLALRSLLPGALWGGRAARGAGGALRAHDPSRARPPFAGRAGARLRPRARSGASLYETLEALGGAAPVRHLVEQLKLGPTVLEGLVRSGLARIDRVAAPRDPFADLAVAPPPDPDAPTSGASSTGSSRRRPTRPSLIEGVTGSGKTLVYLDVLRAVVASGHGAILLVPEIALTPQTVARVRGVFGDQVAVLHSGLSDAERADAWRALRSGARAVAVGARSAVFAPVQRLAAIVVDEEHEPSYKQGTAPRYHARDVALVRARLEGARLILGSATPSLETLHRVAAGTVRRFALPRRVDDRPLPPVELVDLRTAPRVPEAGCGAVERTAGPGGARGAGARGAGDPAPEPARLRLLSAVPGLRRRPGVPALRHRAHRARHAGRAALPLLRARGAGAHRVCPAAAHPPSACAASARSSSSTS